MPMHPMLSRFAERMQRQLVERHEKPLRTEPFRTLYRDWHDKDFMDLLLEARGHTVAAETERQEMLEAVRQGLAEGKAGQALDPEEEKQYREQIAHHCTEAALYLAMIADNAEMGREILPRGKGIAGGEPSQPN